MWENLWGALTPQSLSVRGRLLARTLFDLCGTACGISIHQVQIKQNPTLNAGSEYK